MTRKEEINQSAYNALEQNYIMEDNSSAFVQGYNIGVEWADRTMLNKVCEWVKDNGNSYIEIKDGQLQLRKWIVNDLRKAMGG